MYPRTQKHGMYQPYLHHYSTIEDTKYSEKFVLSLRSVSSLTMSKSYKSALAMLVSVFFFWGFVAASNDILIPVFKKALTLSQFESQLISLAFYIAYTVGSLMYFGISSLLKRDILNRKERDSLYPYF